MQYVFSHNSYHTFNPFANRGKQFFFYIIRKKKITRHKIEIRKNMFRRKERSAPFFIFCIKKIMIKDQSRIIIFLILIIINSSYFDGIFHYMIQRTSNMAGHSTHVPMQMA